MTARAALAAFAACAGLALAAQVQPEQASGTELEQVHPWASFTPNMTVDCPPAGCGWHHFVHHVSETRLEKSTLTRIKKQVTDMTAKIASMEKVLARNKGIHKVRIDALLAQLNALNAERLKRTTDANVSFSNHSQIRAKKWNETTQIIKQHVMIDGQVVAAQALAKPIADSVEALAKKMQTCACRSGKMLLLQFGYVADANPYVSADSIALINKLRALELRVGQLRDETIRELTEFSWSVERLEERIKRTKVDLELVKAYHAQDYRNDDKHTGTVMEDTRLAEELKSVSQLKLALSTWTVNTLKSNRDALQAAIVQCGCAR